MWYGLDGRTFWVPRGEDASVNGWLFVGGGLDVVEGGEDVGSSARQQPGLAESTSPVD